MLAMQRLGHQKAGDTAKGNKPMRGTPVHVQLVENRERKAITLGTLRTEAYMPKYAARNGWKPYERTPQ